MDGTQWLSAWNGRRPPLCLGGYSAEAIPTGTPTSTHGLGGRRPPLQQTNLTWLPPPLTMHDPSKERIRHPMDQPKNTLAHTSGGGTRPPTSERDPATHSPLPTSRSTTPSDPKDFGWLMLLLPLACCGGPLVIVAVTALGAAAAGGLGAAAVVAVAATVVVVLRRRRNRLAGCCPPSRSTVGGAPPLARTRGSIR